MTTERARRLADGVLTIVLVGLTFLLGCQEVFDADIWWHLRAGRRILEQRAVPRVDPFTFASAGRPWIDMHWLFQAALATAFAAGGVAGMVLLAAAVVTSAVSVGWAFRRRDWPAWVVGAAWLPGLLLASNRFDPRPELVTLFCLCAFFGILTRARESPGRLWALVPIQVLWVNAHGLFVLGPWTLGLFLLDRVVMGGMPPWRRLLPPCLAVVLACLANPYGLQGLLFPLELLPKLTEGGGSYKSYIGEFMSPRTMIATYRATSTRYDLYLRLYIFLLAALPPAALVPSAWRAWSSTRPGEGEPGRPWTGAWVVGMVVALGLAAAVALGLPGDAGPAWRPATGPAIPWALAGAGTAAAVVLAHRSRGASAIAVAGSWASAAWIAWLVGQLFGPGPPPWASAIAIGLGLPAIVLAVRAGSRPFGPLLAATFAGLSMLAVRNISLFGIVAGAAIAAELGEWAAQLGRVASPANPSTTRGGLAARLGVIVAAGLVVAAVASGRFYAATDEYHRLGLRERPLHYAHDACRFAGRPGMPDRALVFGLDQAAVYVYHNAPTRRVFIDGRLEVASREAFELNVRLHHWLTDGDPRWAGPVRRMGNPAILLDHADNAAAEATLLADPRWRCVYLDAVAALFLPRGRSGPDLDRERAFPTIDFAGRHFRRPPDPATPALPGAAYSEGRALVRVGAALGHRPAPLWSVRVPIALVAMDRAIEAIAETPGGPGPWTILGHAALGLAAARDPRPGAPPIGPGALWDPAIGLPWAQATSAYREALKRAPANESALRSLTGTFAMRGMDDARRPLESRLAGAGSGADADRPVLPPAPRPGDEHLADAIDDLLRHGRPAAAVALAIETSRRGRALPWAVADRVAGASMHLGDPSTARRAWLEAAAPPSEALRAARVADADFAAWAFDAAEAGYRRALTLDPDLADARVGLALVGLERGRAVDALHAARAALPSMPTDPRRRSFLEGILSLAEPYAR